MTTGKNGKTKHKIARVSGADMDLREHDLVMICKCNGMELGRGLSAYSSTDATRIAGFKTSEIENILGYRGRDEVIHRDDLVLD